MFVWQCELDWCTVDVNECITGLGPCGTKETAVSCQNTNGSYTCQCMTGYNFTDGACRGNMRLFLLLTSRGQFTFCTSLSLQVDVSYGHNWYHLYSDTMNENYTAWWQRHIRVSSLPNAVIWKWSDRDSNPRPFRSRAYALALSHTGHVTIMRYINSLLLTYLLTYLQSAVCHKCNMKLIPITWCAMLVNSCYASPGIVVIKVSSSKADLHGHSRSLAMVPFDATNDFLLVSHCNYVHCPDYLAPFPRYYTIPYDTIQ